jgi:hypothetical protein
MKKWYLIIFIAASFYIIWNSTRKKKGGKREFLRRLNSYINLLAWFLLAVYGLAFIYYVLKGLF